MLTLPLLLWTFRRFGLLERKTVLAISPWSPALWGTWCSWSWTLLPPLRCTWEHFIMFVNTVLHLSFSLLVYSSMLQMYLLCMVPFMYVRYYFFVLFVMAKISFIQLWVHISKADPLMSCLRCQACAPPRITPPLYASAMHPVSPLLKLSAIVPGIYFSALHHCVRVLNISFDIASPLATASYIKQWLYHARLNKSRTN